MRAAGVRDLEQLHAVAVGWADEAFILELLQRGVNRPGARAPPPIASLLDLLHQLVAVARLFIEQEQQRGTHVAAALTTAPAERRSATEPELGTGGAKLVRWPSPVVPVAAAFHEHPPRRAGCKWSMRHIVTPLMYSDIVTIYQDRSNVNV